MAREMSRVELRNWEREMKEKEARLTGKSTYKGSNMEELMSEGASGKVFLKYKRQEKERAEKKAELARINTDLSPSEKSAIFKSISEAYGASLAPRMSWIEIEKVTKATYDRMLVESGIKEIDVKSYKRYEPISEKGKGKGSKEYFEERRKRKDLSVPQKFLEQDNCDPAELEKYFWENFSTEDLLE